MAGGDHIGYEHCGAKKGVNESRKFGVADATMYANKGQLEKANAAVDAMVENHAMSPQEAEAFKKKLPETAAKASADQAIVRYPIDSRKIIEGSKWFNDLTPADQKVVLSAADTAKTKKWKQNLDDMLAQKLDSTTKEIPENDLKEAIKNNQIDPKAGENLIAAQKKTSTAGDESQKHYVGALAHDPVAWQGEKPDEYAAKLMREVAKIKDPTVRQQAAEDVDKELQSVEKNVCDYGRPGPPRAVGADDQDFKRADRSRADYQQASDRAAVP